MSLSKKLWIAIIVLMILAFGGSFVASTISAKNYLQQQLQMKNIDNAASLALSLSQMEKDPVKIELMISAQFDTGHYQYIGLTDPNGRLIEERRSNITQRKVPQWFTKLVPINVEPGIAQVQNGWKQYGTVRLESHGEFAYRELWNATLLMLLWSILMIAASGWLGTWALRRILQPLTDIVNQAEAIGDRRFITIDEPKTLEFKALVAAMNRLANRIKAMLKEESQRLEQLRVEANYDHVSRLMNRDYFLNRVDAYMANEESFTGGVLVMCRVAELAEINQKLGRRETDELLKRLREVLLGMSANKSSFMAGRITGIDLAIFSGHVDDSFALASLIKGALSKAAGLKEPYTRLRLPTVASRIMRDDKMEPLVELAIATLNETNAADADLPYVINESEISRHKESNDEVWRESLSSAIAARRLKLGAYPVVNTKGEQLHQESPVRLQATENGPWLPAGDFISWAIQFDLITRVDNLVAELAMDELTKGEEAIGLNISARAICSEEFTSHLYNIIRENPVHASRLWLEVPEQGVFDHLPEFRKFTTMLKPLGCKIGMEHVGTQVSRLGELHDIGLDYIKIDASVIRGIDKNPGNKAFLRGLCLIAHTIGWLAIAEGVMSEEELAALPELGIDGMTGPAIK